VAQKRAQSLIFADLDAIRLEVNASMVAGADMTALLSLIQQIVAAAMAGQC